MNPHIDKTQEDTLHTGKQESRAAANHASIKQSRNESVFQFADNRSEAIVQRELQEMANNSPKVKQLRAFQKMTDKQAGKDKVVSNSTLPIQRNIKFLHETNEELKEELFTDKNIMDFLMAYGMTSGVQEKIGDIQKLLEDNEEHEYEDIAALLEVLGHQEKQEKTSWTVRVESVDGILGDMPDITPEFERGKDTNQGSHPIYPVKLSGGDYLMKAEIPGYSGFKGMEMMNEQGIEVPVATQFTDSDGKQWILMKKLDLIEGGLKKAPEWSDEKLISVGKSLGLMHVADIRMLNLDRLPWLTASYPGHLRNVFNQDGEVIGLDSDMALEPSSTLLEEQEVELAAILNGPKAYATQMITNISETGSATDQPIRLDPRQQEIFADSFALGLAVAI